MHLNSFEYLDFANVLVQVWLIHLVVDNPTSFHFAISQIRAWRSVGNFANISSRFAIVFLHSCQFIQMLLVYIKIVLKLP